MEPLSTISIALIGLICTIIVIIIRGYKAESNYTKEAEEKELKEEGIVRFFTWKIHVIYTIIFSILLVITLL